VKRHGARKSSESGQSLVTILFVLGVVGWGFFAIDRLTESEQSTRPSRMQGRALGHESGWKKNVRDWLNKRLSSSPQAETEQTEHTVSRNIPLAPDPQGLRREELPSEDLAAAGESASFLLYKLNSRGQPVLTQVRRELRNSQDLKGMVSQLIRGPSLKEQDAEFIDSFIRKPRVIGARVAGSCAQVNLDSSFGAGVSYQTLRYQILQIFRNVEAWQGVSCLELQVQGRYMSHLGSDGLFMPRRIDASWIRQNL
jgi:spore germination protein GerM